MTDNPHQTKTSIVAGIDADRHFLADPAHILLALADEHGACEFVSPSWPVFTGRAAHQEWDHGWRDQVHPDDRAMLDQVLQEALQAQQAFRIEYRYRRADYSYRRLLAQGMVRSATGGRFAGHILQCVDVTAYQKGEAELEQTAQRMIDLLQKTSLIAAVLDRDGKILFSNGSLCLALQYDNADIQHCALFQRHLAPANLTLLETLYPDGAQHASFPAEFESELLDCDGRSRHILWHAIALSEYCGHEHSTILIGDDVTAAKISEQQLRLTARVYECTNQAMVVTDVAGNILSVNQAFTKLTGYSREEALGQNPRVLQSCHHDTEFYRLMWKSIHETGHWHGDIWDRRKDGSIYPKFLSISAIRDGLGQLTNYAGIFYDISERKEIEERLDFLAHYDTLTGLPNRHLLLDRLEQSVERACRDKNRVGLLYLDLDSFKHINDTWGHAAGDAVLQAAAQRMKACLRSVDTAARIGGDEFVLLLTDIGDIEALSLVAEKVLAALAPPYRIDGHTLEAPASIGISIYPDDHTQADVLLKQSDRAMYEAKSRQRGSFRFYHDVNTPPVAAQLD